MAAAADVGRIILQVVGNVKREVDRGWGAEAGVEVRARA